MPEHPSIKLFRENLQKRQLSSSQVDDFNRWRNNGKKCEGDLKIEADKLWAEYEKAGASSGSNLASSSSGQNPSRKPEPRPDRNARNHRPGGAGRPVPTNTHADNAGAGDPSILGEPFHNPYTFIPFASKPPRRVKPTLLSVDEVEKDRFTGVLDLEVKLLSPLLTNESDPVNKGSDHKTYKALAIGTDIVVPATGVRGSLRSLLSVLTGGTLGHLDEEAWLCQGRDARLGPATPATQGIVPENPFLAEVVEVGEVNRPGRVRLGKTKLIKWEDLEQASRQCNVPLNRPKPGSKGETIWSNEAGTSLSKTPSQAHAWQVKLSGPINNRGKREGIFLAGKEEIILPTQLWSAFYGRHRHADKKELMKGDLVWLEPVDPKCHNITKADEVKSIQWARWGRTGERLLDIVSAHHPHVLPDAFNPDGLVDEVTNLFGQVPRPDMTKEVPIWADREQVPSESFAARVRLGNLIFKSCMDKMKAVSLAPLQQPHPGCAAFYREVSGDSMADLVANHGLPLRGYKVYRTSSERGSAAPWLFANQGISDYAGRMKDPHQKANKTGDLLPEENAPLGHLRVTLRALSPREVTLVLASCSVDWRLGGGKPLGLGHCRIVRATLRPLGDDGTLGEPLVMTRADETIADLPGNYKAELGKDVQLLSRLDIWQKVQKPVAKLRYPRAAIENNNKKNWGGHIWYQRHVTPLKSPREGEYPQGLETLHIAGPLSDKAGKKDRLRAQPLPILNPKEPQSDILYGYNLYSGSDPDWVSETGDHRKQYKKFEPFDPARHARPNDHSGGNQSQNQDTRRNDRKDGR